MKIENDKFILDEETSFKFIKLLEYIPESWNIGKILNKKVLTDDELQKLLTAKKHTLLAQSIRNQLNGKDYDKSLYMEAVNMSINKLVDEKFDIALIKKALNEYLTQYKTYDACVEVIQKKDKTTFDYALLNVFERCILGDTDSFLNIRSFKR